MKHYYFISLLFCIALNSNAQNLFKSWWTVTFPTYPATYSCLLNLRYLNEAYAAQFGFIQLGVDGISFVQGNGKTLCFLVSNGGNLASEMNDEKLDSLAQFFANIKVTTICYQWVEDGILLFVKLTNIKSKTFS